MGILKGNQKSKLKNQKWIKAAENSWSKPSKEKQR